MALIEFVRNGLARKLGGLEKGKARILIIENPSLGFDLGPRLAQVLRVPYQDARAEVSLQAGRSVVSSHDSRIPHEFKIDLNGHFGDYLLEQMTRGVDVHVEALKFSMQQLLQRRGRS